MTANERKIAKPTILMILDGFGRTTKKYGNAIMAANTPFLDKLFSEYPNTTLDACGEAVGLPKGQMGNSEVGHMNIGAGRVVYQELSRINNEIKSGDFFKNKAFLEVMDKVKIKQGALHLIGMLSDGGVHSHIEHLFALLELAKMQNISKVYVHAILDGRDVPPKCAEKYILQLEEFLNEHVGIGEIATIGGRYYGMDRDKRWDRVKLHFDAINSGKGVVASSATSALKAAYENGQSDEFVIPVVIEKNGKRPCVDDNDGIIMFNFRPDRARQLARVFTDREFDGFTRENYKADVPVVSMTNYDASLKNITVAYEPQVLKNTLGEYIASLGLKQLRIAETEKYAHVTFFFNGGVEKPNTGEDRILINSPHVATYDLKPEMSAYEVTDRLIEEIKKDKYDVIILNYANSDMVGHTGVFSAAVKAIEVLDECVKRVVTQTLEQGGQILLTADHGNSDEMLDDNGDIVTAHSFNPVPLVHIAKAPKKLKAKGALCDLAPTLLDLMDIKIPCEMTGKSLAVKG